MTDDWTSELRRKAHVGCSNHMVQRAVLEGQNPVRLSDM